jgi:DNA-binding protein H-NS
MTEAAMTKGEREELARLIRQREKVLKSAARQRSAELIADFENQMSQIFSFDQDEIWAQATRAAEAEVAKAQRAVAARCRDLGIPDRFAPSLRLAWSGRGYDNAVEKRRIELRRMATTHIEALERKAATQIELSCLDTSTKLLAAGLTSEAARQFLDALPSVEGLMPALSFNEIAGESEPPIAEQLVSSNALRQRRHRERLKASHSAPEALGNAAHNAVEGETEAMLDRPQPGAAD